MKTKSKYSDHAIESIVGALETQELLREPTDVEISDYLGKHLPGGDEEDLLQLAESSFRSQLERKTQLFLKKDLGGRFTDVSDRVCEILGLERDQIIGRTDQEIFPHDLADDYQSRDHEIFDEKTDELDVEEPFYAQGQLWLIRSIKVPRRDEGGKVIGLHADFWFLDREPIGQPQMVLCADAPKK